MRRPCAHRIGRDAALRPPAGAAGGCRLQRVRQASLQADRLQRVPPRAVLPRLLDRPGSAADDRERVDGAEVAGDGEGDRPSADRKLDTLRDMFDALRACWVPPPQGGSPRRHANVGAVRLQAQRRDHRAAAHDLCSPGAPAETREIYPTPSRRRSSAARRCISAQGWAARSPAARSPSASSTIGRPGR